MKYLYIYLFCINIFAVIVTVHDKNAAQRDAWRVKERTLMLIAALGGSPAMYLTMLTIHHKTRKPLFMVGIPLIFIAQAAAFLIIKMLWL